MQLVYYPNDILKTKCKEVGEVDEQVIKTLDSMVNIMKKYEGIGLAAPQVGLNLRLITMLIDNRVYQMINPKILEFSEEKINYDEGCLSIPKIYVQIKRPKAIDFVYYDIHGKEHREQDEGLLARCLQHEMDHLDGVLMLDRISKTEKALVMMRYKIKRL